MSITAATRRPRVPKKSPHLATPGAVAEARHLTTSTTHASEVEEERQLTTDSTRTSEAEEERQLTTDPTRASEAEEERQATSAVESAGPSTHGLEKRRREESGSTHATVPAQSRSDVISVCMMSA